MAVAFDAASSGVDATEVTAKSWSHTCTGDDLMLIVGMAFRHASTAPTSIAVTYNGVSMTEITTLNHLTYATCSMFYLANPATGANTIAATWTNVNAFAGGGISFTGAGDTPGTEASTASSSGASTIDVSSATDEMVVDAIAYAGSTTPTVGADQTTRVGLGVGDKPEVAMSTEAGAATVTMSWTNTPDDVQAQIGVSIPEAASGTNFQVNVDDTFKTVSAITLNKDDAWKSVAAAQVNVDDAWKTIF